MKDVIDRNVDEEIEILDVIEDDVKSLLEKESQTRENMLKRTNEELIDHTQKMLEYSKLRQNYKALQEKYIMTDMENKKSQLELNECKMELKLKDEENIQLKTQNEKNKKKLITLQSLLQVLIHAYGINDIIKVIGIPYIKLKEYLQD